MLMTWFHLIDAHVRFLRCDARHGIAVLVLQQHHVFKLLAQKGQTGTLHADQAWDRGAPLRRKAVTIIVWSMPLMLLAAAAFTVTDPDVAPGDWVAMGLLVIISVLCAKAIRDVDAAFQPKATSGKKMTKGSKPADGEEAGVGFGFDVEADYLTF